MITWRADRSQLDPQFADDIDAVLGADPGHWIITCTARDRAVEHAGHEAWLADHSKPKFTDPDNSAHCCVPARAVDVTLVVGEKDDWDYEDENWKRLYAAILAHPRLHSGISFCDGDHIEALHWKQLAAVAAVNS